MFTWICPKCGSEVPPAYSDCPNCAAQASSPTEGKTEPKPASAAPLSNPVPPPPNPVPPARTYQAPTYPAPEPPVFTAQTPIVSTTPIPPATPPSRTHSPILIAILTGLGIVALLGILYVFVLPNKRSTTDASTEPTKLENASTAASEQPTHPLAKHLELTGFR